MQCLPCLHHEVLSYFLVPHSHYCDLVPSHPCAKFTLLWLEVELSTLSGLGNFVRLSEACLPAPTTPTFPLHWQELLRYWDLARSFGSIIVMEGGGVGTETKDFLPLPYSGRSIILPRMGTGGSPFSVTLQHLHIPSFLLDSWFPSS